MSSMRFISMVPRSALLQQAPAPARRHPLIRAKFRDRLTLELFAREHDRNTLGVLAEAAHYALQRHLRYPKKANPAVSLFFQGTLPP